MACACTNRARIKYVWTNDDGTKAVTYDNEVVAKAKVRRAGGSYNKVTVGGVNDGARR